jgi:hypothetical protein
MILLTVGTLLSPPRKACMTETGWLPQMAINLNDWTKELEVELTMLAFDMWATQKRLEEKGFRVASGNKTPTGWCLKDGVSPSTIDRVNAEYGNREHRTPTEGGN